MQIKHISLGENAECDAVLRQHRFLAFITLLHLSKGLFPAVRPYGSKVLGAVILNCQRLSWHKNIEFQTVEPIRSRSSADFVLWKECPYNTKEFGFCKPGPAKGWQPESFTQLVLNRLFVA